MAGKSFIEDGFGKGICALVTSRGQLVTAPLDFSTPVTKVLNATNTAFSFFSPIAGKRFVITDVLVYADKNVGVADASVQLYEANSPTSTTISSTILNFEMLKQTSRDITGINLITNPGVWINMKTNDDIIYATVMGYYIDV